MASGHSTTVASDKMPEADWWQAFHNQELTQFIERALSRNHDVRRAVSRVLEGRAAVTTAGAGLYPQLNVQGSYTNLAISKNTLAGLGLAVGQQPGPQVFATPGSSFDLWNGAADLRLELDLWGRIRRGLEAASAESQATEQDARAIALTLIGDVGQLPDLHRLRAVELHRLERRSDILQAEATLVAANARIGQARAYFFPRYRSRARVDYKASNSRISLRETAQIIVSARP
ncbi:MAG: TolC family protein [Nitrospira sp.]|nr:TolC family protein [Nitrospira sp.]